MSDCGYIPSLHVYVCWPMDKSKCVRGDVREQEALCMNIGAFAYASKCKYQIINCVARSHMFLWSGQDGCE